MAMNSDATSKHGGNGGGEIEKRVTAVEARLGVIEKTMVTTEVFKREIGAVRVDIANSREGLRGEIGAVRDELHVGLGSLRQDMHAGLGSLRQDMQAGLGALRQDMHVGLGALRQDMHVALGALRQDMHTENGGLRQELHAQLGAVRVDIAKVPFELVKWLIALSGIAAAVATAVYNLWFR